MIIKAVTSGEMREIDRIAIDEVGIPASVLMNNAGRSVADYILENFKEKKISIFCGTGNNGGDGFTAAYYLANNRIIPVIYLSGKKDKLSETSNVFMNLCEKMKIEIHEIDEKNLNEVVIPEDSVIIDAVLGTGSTDSPRGIPLDFIRLINGSNGTVISIDIPSGLSSNGEYPSGECIKADVTITIGLPKISLVTYPCKQFCGRVIIQDIGFPYFLTTDSQLKVNLIDDFYFNALNIFNSTPDTHKGERGHTLIIGGFENMEGAALLTASALFNTGCGLVTIATQIKSRPIIAGKIPESMTLSLPDDPDTGSLSDLFESLKITSLIIGPGLGRTVYSEQIFKNTITFLKKNHIKRVLIDGDGLFHLAEFIKNEKLPGNIEFIITPHFLEASRILGKSVELLKLNRLESCKELSRFTGCITVLKGPSTIVSDGETSYINTTGNSGLATAGSGDVLTGIIGSFMNRCISAIEAAAAGVFIHGACADLFGSTAECSTMSASDIVLNIKSALKRKHNR